jgi:hypothetical protein
VSPTRDTPPERYSDRLRARWPWWLLAAIPLVLLLGWLLRGPVAEWLWSEAEAETLRQQAEVALQQGRLTADDGTGARELYAAAMAIDPDRAELRSGLARVAQAAVQQARDAAERGAFERAHRQLRLARELSAPRAQIDAVAEILRRREAAVAGIDDLLRAADAARAAGKLHGGADAALPLYRRILQLQPQHLEALEGREDALASLLQEASEALRRGQLTKGAAEIVTAIEYDRGHADLPDAQALLAQVADGAHRRADADLRGGRLQRAAEGYRALRSSGVELAAADNGLAAVARAYLVRARADAADFRFDRANAALASAQALAPSPDALDAELKDVRAVIMRAERTQRGTGPRLSSRTLQRRVGALLEAAAAAEARGDWLTPPGDSAYDTLRVARALAPDDEGVKRASQRILPRVADCFENALRDNRLQRARVCLDARLALEGESRTAIAARGRLARRWIAVGEERLGAGDVEGARAAHDAARGLEPRVPGLSALSERLHAAESVER